MSAKTTMETRKRTAQTIIPSRSLTPQRRFALPQHVEDVPESRGKSLHNTAAQPGFGHDFSRIQVHSDARAVEPRQSCPLASASPRFCPFGGACHTCPPRIQAKLTIGQPGDQYEQEADIAVEQVMRMPEPRDPVGSAHSRQAQPSTAPPIVHEALRSPGQPLNPGTRAFMEPRFVHDFSRVRVHTDEKAAESTQAVNALAYAVGQDVVFGTGQYAPQTSVGQRLMAHELTHVVQQNMDSVQKKLVLGHAGDVYEREADQMVLQAHESIQSDVRPVGFTAAPVGRVQGQFITPLGAGGGFGGLLERDRRRTFGEGESQTNVQQPKPSGESDCNVQLCFLPLEVLIDQGVPPEAAYVVAVHAYLKWNGRSAGFTRLAGERISDARVISPEPRAGEPHERCVQARLRTIPSPIAGQLVSVTPIGTLRDIISYGADVYTGLRECRNPTCQSAKQRIQNTLVDDRRGLYSLFDENCETWARNVLSAACMEAPSAPSGGYGNLIQQILRETPGGDLYHLARRLLDRTRPMPKP